MLRILNLVCHFSALSSVVNIRFLVKYQLFLKVQNLSHVISEPGI